ncbi:hypothetical protein MMAN_36720 [Mycobacterium mantenii]|uniref:Uncharacterized protein n=1 Tax=Mycobacterium mantenii TaxID=560555 RepID=A0ABM7JVD4_MYCNT|nr:hypothetical protein MMAN_36720 [Mycobacterium mantenii]
MARPALAVPQMAENYALLHSHENWEWLASSASPATGFGGRETPNVHSRENRQTSHQVCTFDARKT